MLLIATKKRNKNLVKKITKITSLQNSIQLFTQIYIMSRQLDLRLYTKHQHESKANRIMHGLNSIDRALAICVDVDVLPIQLTSKSLKVGPPTPPLPKTSELIFRPMHHRLYLFTCNSRYISLVPRLLKLKHLYLSIFFSDNLVRQQEIYKRLVNLVLHIIG